MGHAGLVEAVISVDLGWIPQAGPQTVATAKARLADWSAVSDSNECQSSHALDC